MFVHAVQAALAEPLGLKPRGKPAARRKERGSGGESRARSAARKAYAAMQACRDDGIRASLYLRNDPNQTSLSALGSRAQYAIEAWPTGPIALAKYQKPWWTAKILLVKFRLLAIQQSAIQYSEAHAVSRPYELVEHAKRKNAKSSFRVCLLSR